MTKLELRNKFARFGMALGNEMNAKDLKELDAMSDLELAECLYEFLTDNDVSDAGDDDDDDEDDGELDGECF